MNNEQKDKKEKIDFICFLVASIIFYIVSIINFIDKNTTPNKNITNIVQITRIIIFFFIYKPSFYKSLFF